MATKPWGVQNAGNSNTVPSVSTLNTLASNVGASPQYVGWAKNFAGNNTSFTASDFTSILNYGATPILTWTPNDNTGVLHLSNTNITGGTYDSLIDSYANGLKALNSTVYIRFAHEPNGNWYDWAPGNNSNTTSSYIAMWRYVWNRFNNLGVTNVKWVWCLNIHWFGETITNWTQIYPGDTYVDYIALDGYNYGEPSPHVWQTYSTVFSSSITDIVAVTSKTFYINEMGCVERPEPSGKATWILDALAQIKNDSRIAFFLWFDGASSGSDDFRLTTSTNARLAFASAIQSASSFGKLNI